MNVFDLAQSDTVLKKVSSTGGGEWAGPCPFCQGRDRFRVQPFKKEGGRWFCRHCGEDKWHDAIDYVIRRNGVSFMEAKRMVDGETAWQPIIRKPVPVQKPLHQAEYDVDVWQTRAAEYIKYCEAGLIEHAGDQTASWLFDRGIIDTLQVKARLGYNSKDLYDAPEKWGYPSSHEKIYLSHGLIIPNIDSAGIHAIKVRRADVEGNRKYIVVKGSSIWMYGGWTCDDCMSAFLFESELDALLGYSSGYKFGYLALPAGQHIKPQYNYIMGDIQDVVVMPDNDEPGTEHAKVAAKIPSFYMGMTPPQGKDISEYYQLIGKDNALILDFLYTCAGQIPAKVTE